MALGSLNGLTVAQHSLQTLREFITDNLRIVGEHSIGILDQDKIEHFHTRIRGLLTTYTAWYDLPRPFIVHTVEINEIDRDVIDVDIRSTAPAPEVVKLYLKYPSLELVPMPMLPPKPSEIPFEYDPDERFSILIQEED